MDNLIKLKILYYRLCDAYRGWRTEIWKQDLNEYYCCNGHGCGCYGMTIREVEYAQREQREV